MQGNELDDFFRSSLDELEIQPSAHVWAGITNRLDADKRKRSLVSFLSIAAGIALAIAMGVLFIPNRVKVNKQEPLVSRVLKDTSSVIKHVAAVSATHQQNKIAANVVIAPIKNRTTENTNHDPETNSARKTNVQQQEIAKPGNKPDIVSPLRGDDLANARITDNTENGIAVQPVVNDLNLVANKPVALLAQLPNKPINAPAKKRRIHSVGDLFNVVIAAVDKRKDKVIEFSNTDEDDAVITGINLGIIKVKKEK